MKKKRKISDLEFLTVLRENGGLFARTAKAIQTKFGISYSRQAVRDRAMKFHTELNDIEEENVDTAEEGLFLLIKNPDPRIQFKAIEFYLKNKAKKRGYGESDKVVAEEIDIRKKRISAMSDEELDAELKKYGYGKLE